MTQHLHNALGNAVGECKKRMYERLKQGADLEDALRQFLEELKLALSIVLAGFKT